MRISVLALTVSLLACAASVGAGIDSNEQPTVVRAVAPTFPVPANGPHAMGSVVVEVTIDAPGTVTQAQTVTGHPFLRRPAEKAARQWVFASTSMNTEVRRARLTFVFKFMDEETSEEDLSPIFMPPYQVEVRRLVPILKLKGS